MNKSFKLLSDLDNLRIIETYIDEMTSNYSFNKECYGNIMLSVMEAVTNAIVHGNDSDSSKYVYVDFSIDNKILNVVVRDEGEGFIPTDLPDPTDPSNLENLSGRGVFIMKKLSDEISFNEKGTEVTMKFKI